MSDGGTLCGFDVTSLSSSVFIFTHTHWQLYAENGERFNTCSVFPDVRSGPSDGIVTTLSLTFIFYSFCLQCTNIQKMILKTFVEMHKVKGFCIYFFHFSWTSRSETAEKQQRQERTRAFMTSDFHVFFYDGSSNKYDTVSKTVFTEFTGLCEKICFTWRSFYCISRPEDSLWDCGSIVSRLPNQTLLMNGFGNQRPRCIFTSPSTYGST